MKELLTYCGKRVLVDDDIYEEYKNRSLVWDKNAVRLNDVRKSLAALILDPPSGFMPDHKNRNPLDCQRVNLRAATPTQNACNKGRCRKGTSKYKGVAFHISNGRWIASIAIYRKQKHLGSFDSELEAAKAYDKAALVYHGEFAFQNL